MRIIFLRYGSLVSFENRVMKQIDISKKLHIPRSTVNYNLVCFERRGFRLDALGRKYERFAALPAGVKAALLAPHLL